MNNKSYALLTPSARSAFDDIMTEYRDAMLEKASDIAKQYSMGEVEISLRDIMEAKNSLSMLGDEAIRLRRKERVATTALLGGFSYVFLGLLMYFATNEVPHWNRNSDISYLWLFIIIMGMLLMVYPIFFNLRRMARNRVQQELAREYANIFSPNMIVKMWAMIEQKGVELMKLRGIETDGGRSINSIYDFLSHELNSRDFIDSINEILSTRNQIVHSQRFSMKREDVEHMLNEAQSIVNELDKRIKESTSKNL